MMKSLYTRLSATSAIAAAVALTTTPAAAQDATTTTPDPVSIESTIATDAEPIASEQAPSTTEATDAASSEPAAAPTPVKKAHAAPVAKVKPVRASSPAKTAVRPAAEVAPAVDPVAVSEPAPAPLISEPTEPAPPTAIPAAQAERSDETALAVGGGALALLLVGGAAAAMRRRRSSVDDVWDEEPMVLTEHEAISAVPEEPVVANPKHDPVFRQAGYVAPPLSAFSWGNAPAPKRNTEPSNESWTERAMRGPTPDNPSLSLKKRLKRAAFFEKRERDAAAGKATPVEADAGLPERAIEARETEFA